MRELWRDTLRFVLMSGVVAGVLSGASLTAAVEIGQEAPDFNLTATIDGTISLSQFRGKQLVLIEFYSADFAPV